MSDEERFDAIVIGAGPAGIACAYVLAREGKSVLVIERGATSGSKNVTGGRVYTYALEMVEPGLHARAALERKVVREEMVMISGNSSMTIDFHEPDFNGELPQSYTVLRAVFDEWFASEAEAQGAMVAAGIKVDDIIEENGKIVGVRAGEDDMYADVVIDAEGVNGLLAQKAGLLTQDITAHQVGVGAKEIIELPAKVIEDRFNLGPEEGAARLILGASEGIQGGGFLYTNKDSISLGVVFSPEQTARNGKSIHEIFQDLKMHPAIYPLIHDGNTVEYGAHLVPELGWRGVPKKLYRDGMLLVGDTAGFVINTGINIRGIDLAIVSGVAAANAIIEADGNVEAVGPAYMKQLEVLKLIPTMKHFAGWPDIIENHRMYELYPKLANDVFRQLFTVEADVPEKLTKAVMRIIKSNTSIWQLMGDGWRGYKSI